MERDVRQQHAESELVHEAAEAPVGGETTKFSTEGAVPPVGASESIASPTASERAYGNDGAGISPELARALSTATPEQVASILANNPGLAEPLLAVVQSAHGTAFVQKALAVSVHRLPKIPAPEHAAREPATTATPASQPKRVDAAHDNQVDRSMRAGWEQIARYTADERSTPEHVRLPKDVVVELERAWQDSLKDPHQEREQGGNLVRQGGDYSIRRRENDSGRQFDQDDSDVGWRQDLVAQVHTHPYRDEKDRVPEQFATFSDGDFDSLTRSDAHMAVLRSGPYTFMISKTKQFDQLVSQFDGDEEHLSQLASRMMLVYNTTFAATSGSFSAQCEAGVMAVCEQFHLVYYVGQGSDLTRKTHRPHK